MDLSTDTKPSVGSWADCPQDASSSPSEDWLACSRRARILNTIAEGFGLAAVPQPAREAADAEPVTEEQEENVLQFLRAAWRTADPRAERIRTARANRK